MMLLVAAGAVQAQEEQKRVLMLSEFRPDTPYNIERQNILRDTLTEALKGSVDYYPEFIDPPAFSEEDHQPALRDFLRRKYGRTRFDVVIVVGRTALEFVRTYGVDLFPGVPVVSLATDRELIELQTPGLRVTGVGRRIDPKGTLDFILKLQPDTTEVVVVAGGLDAGYFEALARRELRGYEGKVAFTYLIDVPFQELLVAPREPSPTDRNHVPGRHWRQKRHTGVAVSRAGSDCGPGERSGVRLDRRSDGPGHRRRKRSRHQHRGPGRRRNRVAAAPRREHHEYSCPGQPVGRHDGKLARAQTLGTERIETAGRHTCPAEGAIPVDSLPVGSHHRPVAARRPGIHYRGAVPPENPAQGDRASEHGDPACDARISCFSRRAQGCTWIITPTMRATLRRHPPSFWARRPATSCRRFSFPLSRRPSARR